MIGDDLHKIDYTLSPCCNPIPGDDVFGFVNKLDKAVFDTAQTHIAIRVHNLPNQPRALNIDDSNIIEIKGLQNEPYFN